MESLARRHEPLRRFAGVDTSGVDGCRALVVGINYAPEHTGIAPYTTQACEVLAAGGARLLVLAGVPHYPHWSVPAPYQRRLRVDERRGQVPVRRLRHVVPSRQTAVTRSAYEVSFGLHVLAQRLPFRPDVVVAVVPSLFGAVAAALTARRVRAPLMLWVQDMMGAATAQSGISGGGRIAAATTALERWVLGRAASVVVVSEAFGRQVVSAGVAADRVHLVPNWTHVGRAAGNRDEVRARLGWGRDETIALHSGNMGLKQGLGNVVAAARAAEAAGSPVRFVLMGDGSQRAALEHAAADATRLQMLAPADSADFADILAAADVLVLNERASAVDMSLPSKLTSYFSAGRPVVAAVPAAGGTAREVQRSGGGVVVGPEDPEVLHAAVARLGRDPEGRAAFGAAGQAHARGQLDRDILLGRIVALVGRTAR